jgi:membrane-bound metal-dependent hydrolase YbcI (DUF457 family)
MLVGAAAAESVRAVTPLPRLRAWAVGAACGLLPDIDYAFRIMTGQWAEIDRSVTHSLLATAVVMLVVWALAGRAWSAVAGAGYASHLVADLLQDQLWTSVILFYPLQQERMEPIYPLFPPVQVMRGEGILGAARGLLREPTRSALLEETAIAAAIFLAVVLIAAVVRRLVRPGAPRAGVTDPAPDAPR